ncbi:hypothetical protein KPL42_15465 [Clostridium gasigenes]|uniref:dCTP deaminase n=1 Tax=Clostridium gasigenes TaxID=94869 RepID=UPI001C0E6AA5|nr:hypothetical protein [Clostridium gasigenes]MBU3089884.1 hypothetical protein [Clostridium gasigenes]
MFYIRKLFTYISLFFRTGVLSDRDIKKLLGYHIFIYPFKKENLKPSSYNLTASKFAFIRRAGKQLLIVDGDEIIIPPGETAIIETQESIYVSKWITGTYHSRVRLVNQGIGHIGTTLDPGFFGISAIALQNTSKQPITIKVGSEIVTIMFYALKSKSSGLHDNMTGRVDDNINLDSKEFYEFEAGKRNIKIIVNDFNIDKNLEIDNKFIKEKVQIIKGNINIKNKKIFVYDVENPVCSNCINCVNKEECAFKLLKEVFNQEEKRRVIIQGIKDWKSKPWVSSRDSLVKEVEKEIKKYNNDKDTLIYSLGTLIFGILVIIMLIKLKKNITTQDAKGVVDLVTASIVPSIAIVIGIIVKYKKIKGD